jgi:hypothetical protein
MAEGRPLRSPTPLSERWEWWERAVQGERPDVSESEPQVGYYKVRKFRYGAWPRGPWLPARVWMEPQDIDSETGELLSDEIIRMEINGKEVNPWTTWTYLASHPITEAEWKWLKAISPLTPDKIPSRSA